MNEEFTFKAQYGTYKTAYNVNINTLNSIQFIFIQVPD
jgi:hypothetical protein